MQDCVTAESWAEKQPSFTARAFNLSEISSTPPNPCSLIGLSSTLIQLEASCFSQSSQQQTYGFSFLRSLWGIHGVLCTAVIPTPVLSTAPSCCERYLWSFLNFLWGLTPLFWQQSHTLKISSITAVFSDSVYNLHRCFSLEQPSLNNTMQPVWVYLKKRAFQHLWFLDCSCLPGFCVILFFFSNLKAVFNKKKKACVSCKCYFFLPIQ